MFLSSPGRSPQVKDGAGHRGDRAGGDQLVRHRSEADDEDDDDEEEEEEKDDDGDFVFVNG